MRRLLSIAVVCVSAVAVGDANPLDGFSPELLKRLMNGEVIFETKVETERQIHKVARLYADKISTDSYVDLTLNYAKYPTLFEEVEKIELKAQDKEKHQYSYAMDFIVYLGGLLPKTLTPEGRHTISRAADPTAVATIVHDLLNYRDKLEFMVQKVRLIPYKSGILIEDDVHIAAKDVMFSSKIKERFAEFFDKYPKTFRQALTGE